MGGFCAFRYKTGLFGVPAFASSHFLRFAQELRSKLLADSLKMLHEHFAGFQPSLPKWPGPYNPCRIENYSGICRKSTLSEEL